MAMKNEQGFCYAHTGFLKIPIKIMGITGQYGCTSFGAHSDRQKWLTPTVLHTILLCNDSDHAD
jgi:hypothetical protein